MFLILNKGKIVHVKRIKVKKNYHHDMNNAWTMKIKKKIR